MAVCSADVTVLRAAADFATFFMAAAGEANQSERLIPARSSQ
jgi:hypothetical protein